MLVVVFSAYLALSSFIISMLLTGTLMFSKKKKLDVPENLLSRVSILKPVKNADSHFENNIKSFYEQDYPDFEILFGLETVNETEVEIINRVAKLYPQIKTTIVYTGTDKELNPKVDNLVKMERFATGTHYWIADANVIVEPDTLKSLMGEYVVNDSKMIFSPILGSGSRSFGSLAENMHLSFTVSGLIISAWALAQRQITVGKSMLMEKKTLENHFGGFSYFLKYLAEDYMIGKKYEKRGIRVSTNYTWVTNVNSDSSIKNFFDRISRWAVMRYNIDKKWYFVEILFLNPFVISILAVLSGNPILVMSGLTVIFFKFFSELACFIMNNRNDRSLKNLLMFIPAFITKEVIVAVSYLIPFFSKKVLWRGRKIKVGKNSIINYQDNVEPVMEEI